MNQPTPGNQPGDCVIVDPLQHPNWDSLVGAHPGCSVFHRSSWARVLRDTYGHTPLYICRFANDGQLEQLLPLMEVSSPWTGRRGVSLPFTDFCPPLVSGQDSGVRCQSSDNSQPSGTLSNFESQISSSGPAAPSSVFCLPSSASAAPSTVHRPPSSGGAQTSAFSDLQPSTFNPQLPQAFSLYTSAFSLAHQRRWRSLEFRSPDPSSAFPDATPSLQFLAHTLDLTPGPEALLAHCDPAVRRAIRKAEKEAVHVQFDTTDSAMRDFYALHCQTRRKHGVPPQPFAFFQNIARHLLASGHGFIALAHICRGRREESSPPDSGRTDCRRRREESSETDSCRRRREESSSKPIAAAVFLHAGREAIYKFGASDERFQHLRPNNLVMWEAIKHCAAAGCQTLHFGRTSPANEGLRRFKLSFGTLEQTLRYYKFDFRKNTFVTAVDRAEGWPNHLFRLLPPPLFRLAGRLLYQHLS